MMTLLFFGVSVQNYVPENFGDDSSTFYWFLTSTVPVLLLFIIKCSVATLLLSARTPDMLNLLRRVLIVEIAVELLALGVDAAHFPDNIPLSLLTLIPDMVWLGYIFRSVRVRHVFCFQDWDVAVNTIHPLKENLGT
jgi:hypothetical protein